MNKLLSFLIIFLCFLTYSQEQQTKCQIYVVDSQTIKEIESSKVFIRTGELIKNSLSGYNIFCNYNDSIYISADGYEFQMIDYNSIIDTIFLELNKIELEPVVITAKKTRTKYYYLGSRSKKCKHFQAYGFDFFKNQKIVTYFPNNSDKDRRIEEGYIYINKIDTTQPNLILTFWENENGQMGKELLKNITVSSNKVKKGWYTLNFNTSNRIKIPQDGIFISIQNLDERDNNIFIGMIEYKDEFNIKTFSVINNIWYELPISENIEERKHYGVKIYFKVK
jgi:hypothetical protein